MDTKKAVNGGPSAKDVFAFVESLEILPSDNLDLAVGSTFNIGVSQIEAREFVTLEEYIREMNFVVSQGVNQRAHLICFPAFSGFLPAPLFPQYKTLMSKIQRDTTTGLPNSVWTNQAISAIAYDCMEVFVATMSALAAAHGVYIMAGTTISSENANFNHRAILFDNGGNIVGVQDKIVSGKIERDMGIEPAGRINVFETPMGNIAILLTDDTIYYEPARIAKNLGADIILNPTAFIGPYDGAQAARGLNVRVQENNIYGVQSVLTGRIPFGVILDGKSGVFAPLKFSLPNSKNCMFIKAIKRNQTQIVTTRLSIDALKINVDPLYTDTNPEFMKKNIDLIY